MIERRPSYGAEGTAVFFTGEENIPAQKAYEAIGFTHIGDYRITALKDSFRWE